MRLSLSIILFFSLFIGCRSTSEEPKSIISEVEIEVKDSISVDGISRTFQYLIPAELSSHSSLLFVLHGSGGNAERAKMATNAEFDRIARRDKDFVIVYPNGYDNHWNDCRARASYLANTENIDDNTFFSEMIDYFNNKYQIDPSKVYVTGISNGGHMCYKLAYEMPDKFSGYAAYVANIPEASLSDCTPKNVTVPMMIINGTKDPINPNDGGWVIIGQDSSRGKVLSTQATAEYWKSLLPCEPTLTTTEYNDIDSTDGSVAIHYQYSCPDDPNTVELISIINGGHIPPIQGADPLPENYRAMLGNRNQDINSPQIVMNFFRKIKK